ncbi:MAG: phasin family protein [Candidatus Promineifilaceae bacterium]|nr:phasin family protein [Candidatus Promineifilaceae bacterium]
MAEQVEIQEEMTVENGQNPVLDMTRKVLLAGIGAVALTQEELEKFVQKLVDRGEIAEKDGRRLINEMMEKRRKQAEEVSEETEEELDKRMEHMLHRMNIPTKDDIAELNRKVTQLSKKVDELAKK